MAKNEPVLRIKFVQTSNCGTHKTNFDYTPYLPKNGKPSSIWLPIRRPSLCESGYHVSANSTQAITRWGGHELYVGYVVVCDTRYPTLNDTDKEVYCSIRFLACLGQIDSPFWKNDYSAYLENYLKNGLKLGESLLHKGRQRDFLSGTVFTEKRLKKEIDNGDVDLSLRRKTLKHIINSRNNDVIDLECYVQESEKELNEINDEITELVNRRIEVEKSINVDMQKMRKAKVILQKAENRLQEYLYKQKKNAIPNYYDSEKIKVRSHLRLPRMR